MTLIDIRPGTSPVVLGQPHGGTFLPTGIEDRLNENGRALADTDWHIARLYDGLLPGAAVVRSSVHRYVIDANRDPDGASLYPGQNTTSLCPTTDFDGRPIWRDGQEPGADEIAERRSAYHAPYHAALRAQLELARDRHGIALLFDCHSIRSHIPFLFEGTLPVFNTGTNGGTACAPVFETLVDRIARTADGYDAVLNGRFRGGWSTRHYGAPATHIHAIQMELAQRAYMDEAAPWTYRTDLAGNLRRHLARMLTELEGLALSGQFTS